MQFMKNRNRTKKPHVYTNKETSFQHTIHLAGNYTNKFARHTGDGDKCQEVPRSITIFFVVFPPIKPIQAWKVCKVFQLWLQEKGSGLGVEMGGGGGEQEGK